MTQIDHLRNNSLAYISDPYLRMLVAIPFPTNSQHQEPFMFRMGLLVTAFILPCWTGWHGFRDVSGAMNHMFGKQFTKFWGTFFREFGFEYLEVLCTECNLPLGFSPAFLGNPTVSSVFHVDLCEFPWRLTEDSWWKGSRGSKPFLKQIVMTETLEN